MKPFLFFTLLFPLIGFSQEIVLREKQSVQPEYCDCLEMSIFAQDDQRQYLGKISTNENDPESIINTFGTYGSNTSSTSIVNRFSEYGNKTSDYSAYNEFASSPPIINKTEKGSNSSKLYLTKNKLLSPALDPDILLKLLKSDCDTSLASEPDLLAFNIWVEESEYYLGDSITVSYCIFNNSKSDLDSHFFTSLLIDTSLVESNRIDRIPAKSSIEGSKRTIVTQNSHRLMIFADHTALISESNESNNKTSLIIHTNALASNFKQNQAKESVLLYPNPLGTNSDLYLDSDIAIHRIMIYNLKGELVLDRFVDNNVLHKSAENINRGVYIMKLFNGQNYFIKKIVVE
jgi:hypothetical protein